MAIRLRAADGKIGIWDGATNTAPFDNPLGNMSRVKFHSDLKYPKIIATYVNTVSLQAINQNAEIFETKIIRAHGRPGVPWVFGKFSVGGRSGPLTGTVPIQADSAGFCRFVTLGANATNIVLYHYAIASYRSIATVIFPEQTMTITTYVTDQIV